MRNRKRVRLEERTRKRTPSHWCAEARLRLRLAELIEKESDQSGI